MMPSRRMFLRGAGATLWLPLLPSALPREARAKVGSPPRRLLFWFVPNGLLPEGVVPTSEGPGYDLPSTLLPLAPLQDRITVVNGLLNHASEGQQNGAHERCNVSLLTDTTIDNPADPPTDVGISVDQFAASQVGGDTPFSSLVLGTGEPNSFGNPLYNHHLCWAGPGLPIAPVENPGTLFDLLFAGADPEATQEEIAKRARLRTSVLDAVLDRTNALSATLATEDRAKLDQFTTGIRELENRIDQLQSLVCEQPDTPADGLDLPGSIAAMHDLMALALQCDHTRVLTYMLGPSSASTSYAFLGVSENHHVLSHNCAYSDQSRNDLLAVQAWQMQQWVDLCAKLAAIPEGDGDLLSNTAVALVTEFSDSNLHTAEALTMLIAGGEAGGISQGQARVYADRPHVDLLASLLQFAGADPTGFGQHQTAPIDLSV